MGRTRRRVMITLPPDLHDRVKVVADRLPGGNVSALAEAALAMHLPTFEAMAQVEHIEDPDEKNDELLNLLGSNFVQTLQALMDADEEEEEAP